MTSEELLELEAHFIKQWSNLAFAKCEKVPNEQRRVAVGALYMVARATLLLNEADQYMDSFDRRAAELVKEWEASKDNEIVFLGPTGPMKAPPGKN